jgi:cellobiose phosphorylase
LGVQRIGHTLSIEPLIPVDWPGFKLHYRFGRTLYHFDVYQGSSNATSMILDGLPLSGIGLTLVDDGVERWIRVDCRARSASVQALEYERVVDK